jgi:hypothetical protein
MRHIVSIAGEEWKTRKHPPAWRVALQILALALQHASAHFCCCRVEFTRILDVFDFAKRCVCADEVRVFVYKAGPFQVFWNGDWT